MYFWLSNEIKLTNTSFQNVRVSNGSNIPVGTTDHSKLSNRDLADQHPISAITGLQEELDSLIQGVIYKPSVSSEGVLSWSNNGGLENPESVNIKGVKGDKGNTPSVVLRYDRETGNLYYSSDGILVDKDYVNSQNLATKDEMNNAIASAITATLNTEV